MSWVIARSRNDRGKRNAKTRGREMGKRGESEDDKRQIEIIKHEEETGTLFCPPRPYCSFKPLTFTRPGADAQKRQEPKTAQYL